MKPLYLLHLIYMVTTSFQITRPLGLGPKCVLGLSARFQVSERNAFNLRLRKMGKKKEMQNLAL